MKTSLNGSANWGAVNLFAGPSAFGLDPSLRDLPLHWHPPARRGDVRRIASGSKPGVLVLCDGAFGMVPAVSHAELCDALDSGWQVWGVSSLGAIRAWELRDEGMRGFGEVYARFEEDPCFTDDEMCLTHFPQEPYFPVTEALINVRFALKEHGTACGIDRQAQDLLIHRLAGLWFGDRSESTISCILVEQAGVSLADASVFLSELRASRIKTRDLAGLLRARPWAGLTNRSAATPSPASARPLRPTRCEASAPGASR